MNDVDDDPHEDVKQHRLTPETLAFINAARRPSFDPEKIRRKRQKFVQVPWQWLERLDGASGKTYALALHLLWLNWRYNGGEIRLSNKTSSGRLNRLTKYRALADLERRGLVSVQRRVRRTPVVRLNLFHP
jgi:hypothetical protein